MAIGSPPMLPLAVVGGADTDPAGLGRTDRTALYVVVPSGTWTPLAAMFHGPAIGLWITTLASVSVSETVAPGYVPSTTWPCGSRRIGSSSLPGQFRVKRIMDWLA